jgi:anti-sigma factor RsiW
MNCQQARLLIDPYADGELDAAAIPALEQHLLDCPGCALAWRNLQGLKKALKQDEVYFTAPAALRQRIKAELPAPTRPVPQRPGWSWNWLTAAMSGVAAVCLALLLTVVMTRPSSDQSPTYEIVSDHIRSLIPGHLMDVVSTDQHTVKPWFSGKVDYSPPVKDLAAEGFPLVGGRLDYLDGHSAAALVYMRQKHIINLLIWPSSAPAQVPRQAATYKGYHLVNWAESGMSFWAVSDLNQKELLEFAEAFRSK